MKLIFEQRALTRSHTPHIISPIETSLRQRSLSSKERSADGPLKYMEEYILNNIRSKRKNILDLYSVNLNLHNRADSCSLPDIVKQANQYKIIKRQLQNMDLEGELSKNENKFHISKGLSNDKDFIVSTHFSKKGQKLSKSTIRQQILKPHPPPKIPRHDYSLNKTVKRVMSHYNPETKRFPKKDKLNTTKPAKFIYRDDIQPWDNPGKIGLPSQHSYGLM